MLKGQTIHRTGDKPTGFYGIADGRVRIFQPGKDGNALLLALLTPGTWFGEISLFDGLPRTHDAVAETRTALVLIPTASFHSLLEEHPALYPHFTRLLCTRVRSAFQFIDSTATLSLSQQLVRRLLMLTSGYGQQSPQAGAMEVTISQESLGQMINSSRQTVNQLLQALQRQGLLRVHYGKIVIPDWERLSHWLSASPSHGYGNSN
ncbi:Crp/Fnr family transcriptional regulator [Alteromonas sp. H39]|uniref:Crp/Fnr family transcriptional regulator n=1 Tax=Alteromonas sp. H39 TaxID=3389876 RepID=UPI0039E0114D